ncbi:MAG: hypothetical protein OXC60_17135 [Litoreibacter sp.]|nr:hypothetical protein [Litoreibacter sp.]
MSVKTSDEVRQDAALFDGSAHDDMLMLDGTGETGQVITLLFSSGAQFEAEVDEHGAWRFAIAQDDLHGLSGVISAKIQASTRTGEFVAEEQIWLDTNSGKIFDHDPYHAKAETPPRCLSLAEAMADQPSEKNDPLAEFQVRMIDLSLLGDHQLALDQRDLVQIEPVSALVIHGDREHTLRANGLSSSGIQEKIGERLYDVYTLEGVDIVVDADIKIIS